MNIVAEYDTDQNTLTVAQEIEPFDDGRPRYRYLTGIPRIIALLRMWKAVVHELRPQ